jgi:hypothetical protein
MLDIRFVLIGENRLISISDIHEVTFYPEYAAYLVRGNFRWNWPEVYEEIPAFECATLNIPVLIISYGDQQQVKMKGDAAVSTWAYLGTLQSSFVIKWEDSYERYIVKPSE